jgi:hypothetical protein
MNAFEELINKLKTVEAKLDTTFVKVLNENDDELKKAQTDQMSIGKNANNNNIGRLKNAGYARRKISKGGKAPFRVADLKDTGVFYRGVKASANSTTLTVTSTDSKKDKLVEKYTDDIFGFNDTTYNKLKQDVLVPDMILKIREQLNS